jgi:biotin transport system substrate-specific component
VNHLTICGVFISGFLTQGVFNMLQTITVNRADWRVRAASIAAFTLLTIVCAKISIETGTVPFTMQVWATLLAGMVLGARDGALSQLAYIALIAIGLPFDARGLGTAAFFGPTGGYLIGFVVAAGVTGFLVERSGARLWQRWLAGIVGVGVIYFFGVSHLMLYTGMDVGKAWVAGAAPFVVFDAIKALLAAGMYETLRAVENRQNKKKKNS